MSLTSRLIARVTSRQPDFVIGGLERPYLRRWWVIPRNRFFNIYLHEFLRSDDDRALHDHPWWNVSVLLDGFYVEHTARGEHYRVSGDIVARRATTAHRIELIAGLPVWTLFITGPVLREWGFLCPQGWIPWRSFVDARDSGSVGKGCDQ